MKKYFQRVLLAASIGTVPALILLVIWDSISVPAGIMPRARAVEFGLIGGPFLFPFVVAGTAMSCCRSVAIRMRPMMVSLGLLAVGATGLATAYWCYILTHGFME
jgi:hypothetical protein